MEWQLKYQPLTGKSPWQVYKIENKQEMLEKSFLDEDEAHKWIEDQEATAGSDKAYTARDVDEASRQSFPASDPPSWTGSTAGQPDNDSHH